MLSTKDANLCPRCGKPIPVEDINVAADAVLCRACSYAFSFSDLLRCRADLDHPPAGICYEQSLDGFRVTATTRSAIAFVIVPFLCVWSGGSVGVIYVTQIWTREFSLLNSLLGIPFLLASVIFGAYALMTVAGRVVLTRQGSEAFIFEGLGPFGWTRRFRWEDVAGVRVDCINLGRGRRQECIRVDFRGGSGARSIRFGTLLSNERRSFLLDLLRRR